MCDCQLSLPEDQRVTKDILRGSLVSGSSTSCGCSLKEYKPKFDLRGKNTFDMESKDYGIGYTQDKKYEFYFDKKDFDIVKEHCWYSDHYGYMVSNQKVRQVDKKTPIKMHRFILIKNGLLNPDEKELVVDHINGIPYDNRKENLRVVTRMQNQANMKLRKDSSTGVKGVYFYKNKYQASMVVNHKKYHIGSFDSLEEAQRAYKKAEEELRGEYARSEENVHNGCLIKDDTA